LKDYAIGGVIGFTGNPDDAFKVKQSTAGAPVDSSSSSSITPTHIVILIAILAVVAYFAMNSS
jgi:hypothetical protein